MYPVEKGFDKNDQSQYCREAVSDGTLFVPATSRTKLNFLNMVFLLLQHDAFKKFVRVYDGFIAILQTDDSSTISNLERVRDKLKVDNISRLIGCFVECNFVIGPKDHPYLQPGYCSWKNCERMLIEFHHPDINTHYKPSQHQGSMRRFLNLE